MEDAALAHHAGDTDGPSLRLDDAFGQGEAQSRPRMRFRRAGIELLELDEQPAQVFPSDADAGVRDFQTKSSARLEVRANAHASTLGGELEGVGKVIVEDLLELARIQDNFAKGGIDLYCELDALRRAEAAQ